MSKKRWFFLIGFVFLFTLLSGLGVFVYRQTYIRNQMFEPFPSSDQIALIPWIRLELNEATFHKDWNEHVFHGETQYALERDEHGEIFLKASSKGTSSVLFREVNAKSSDRPFLTWEWKALQFPSNKKNETLAAKSDNDFAARVYVVFGGGLPINSNIIQYVWDDYFPERTFGESPFFAKTKILVVQSGKNESGEWVRERRDLIMDYKRLFGKFPKANLVAIGLMSDSDNTQTASEAYFRRLEIQKPEDATLLPPLGKRNGNPVLQFFGTVRNGIQSGFKNGVKTSSTWVQSLKNFRN
jgi:hypothetical protein